jgi:hypothetical protein
MCILDCVYIFYVFIELLKTKHKKNVFCFYFFEFFIFEFFIFEFFIFEFFIFEFFIFDF